MKCEIKTPIKVAIIGAIVVIIAALVGIFLKDSKEYRESTYRFYGIAPPWGSGYVDLLSVEKLIAKEINSLTTGRILFNPPNEMKVGVRERVEVRISKTFIEDLRNGLRGRGESQVEELRIGTFMNVRLTGENFDSMPLSHEEQIVTSEGFTQWDFDVMPLKSGTQSLLLAVTLRLKIPNLGEENKDYPVFEKKIKVNVNLFYTTKKFIENYWQWIITAILIPPIGWFFSKRRKAK